MIKTNTKQIFYKLFTKFIIILNNIYSFSFDCVQCVLFMRVSGAGGVTRGKALRV